MINKSSRENITQILLIHISILMTFSSLSCSRIRTQNAVRLCNPYCDGKHFSIVRVAERSKRTEAPRGHSGGTLLSLEEDNSILSWPFSNTLEVDIQDEPFLLRLPGFTEMNEGATSSSTRFSEKGMRGSGYTNTSVPGLVVHLGPRGEELKVISDHEVVDMPRRIQYDSSLNGGYLIDRSRKYVFSWSPTPALYSLHDRKIVGEMRDSSGLAMFREYCRESGSAILDPSLKYMYSIKWNGESNVNTHHTCYVYSFENDTTATVSVPCGENEHLECVEMCDGGFHWVIGPGINRGGVWKELDSSFHTVAEVILPNEGPRMVQERFWDPIKHLLWLISFSPDLESESVSIHHFDLAKNQTVRQTVVIRRQGE